MTQRVIDKLGDIADQLREQAWEAEKLGQLPDETVVYPGHLEHTTIGAERRDNPYLTGQLPLR